MNLVLDDLIFRLQPFGGISTYWACLLSSLKVHSVPHRVERAPEVLSFRRTKLRDTVFHGSYNRFAYGPGVKNVVTVHDLTFEHHRVSTRTALISRALRKRSIEAADAIICVSETTRRDLLDVYGKAVDGKLVAVAHHGNPQSMRGFAVDSLPTPLPFSEREKRVLFVGVRGGYKNFAAALHGFKESGLQREGFRLSCTGYEFTPDEAALIDSLGLTGSVTYEGILTSQSMWNLYCRSLALVYPSRYEGFGLPVLEAMTFGCVSVVSSIPALQEVVGDSTITFDPDDNAAIGAALRSVVASEQWEQRSRVAYERAQVFTWDASLERHLETYRAL
jgi:mannosyltransferase